MTDFWGVDLVGWRDLRMVVGMKGGKGRDGLVGHGGTGSGDDDGRMGD